MWNAGRRTEIHGEFWLENMKEIYHLEDLSVKGRKIIEYILKLENVRACIGLIWVKIGPSEQGNKLSGSI